MDLLLVDGQRQTRDLENARFGRETVSGHARPGPHVSRLCEFEDPVLQRWRELTPFFSDYRKKRPEGCGRAGHHKAQWAVGWTAGKRCAAPHGQPDENATMGGGIFTSALVGLNCMPRVSPDTALDASPSAQR